MNNILRYLSTFLIIIPCLVFSQENQEIDSLKRSIENAPNGKEKAELLLSFSRRIQNTDNDKSDSLANEAQIIGNEIRDVELLSEAYFQRGYLKYKLQKDNEAILFFNKIDSVLKPKKIVNIPYIRTKLYRGQISKFTFTLEGLSRAKEYLEEMYNLSEQSDNDHYKYMAMSEIGNLYTTYFQAYREEAYLDSAKTYNESALEYFIAQDDKKFISKVLWSLSGIETSKGNNNAAEKYLKRRLDGILQSNDSLEIANAYYSLGGFYRKIKQPEKAIKNLNIAKKIYLGNTGFPNTDYRLKFLGNYALAYKELGDTDNAFTYLRKAYSLKDSLDRNKSRQLTIEFEKKYESQKKQEEINLLKVNNQVIAQQKINQRNIYLAGIGLTSAIGIFLFFGFRNRKKTNDKLKELDSVKSSFFANISHEFRTPLALISGPVEQQLQKEQLTDKEKRNLKIAQKNSKRLVKLVDQLLDLSKLESGNRKLNINKGNLKKLFSANLDAFTFLAESNDQQYTTEISLEDHSEYWYDTDIIEKLINNLVSNAIKHSPQGASIGVKVKVRDNILYVAVSNTGSNLTGKDISKLFERFYSTSESNAGTGIGLALTKELVLLHKGNINADSDNDQIIFNVTLPVSRSAFKSSEIGSKPLENSTENAIEENVKITDLDHTNEPHDFSKNDLPILLIIDDNKDLREYLYSLFEDHYVIHTSESGNAGFTKATDIIPDLIITDLMMENGDGLTLTKNCKTTETTSHIPIIMLTAKAGDESELEGLETGADAYITKPFNTDILKRTAQNLIDSRQKLRERYMQEVVLLPKDIELNSTDTRFFERLQQIVDSHLVEVEFDVNKFSDLLGMSRMQLHRKLKAFTGQSATEFIRCERLKLAAKLLKKTKETNVAEIGYAVGFNNPSYFTRCFKKQYGVSPSDFE